MECAQCHDSPFNKWERMDFYELAAFTHGQGEVNKGPWTKVWRDVRDAKEERSDFGNLMRWLDDNVHYLSLGGGGASRIKLPSDYQYKDGDPGEMVGGKTPFGPRIRGSDRKDAGDGREELANWIVDEKNERFSILIANRMWKRIMGNPIFDEAYLTGAVQNQKSPPNKPTKLPTSPIIQLKIAFSKSKSQRQT